MKLYIFRTSALACLLSLVSALHGMGKVDSLLSEPYLRHTEHYKEVWQHFIPKQATIHFAGGIGFLSAGVGWHYGKRHQWETDLLVGFVPKYNSGEAKVTLTLKERFEPWNIRLCNRWSIEPLTTGIFFNTIFGEDFWAHQPERYPKKYYGFPTKLRTHLFIGQRFSYNIPKRHRRYSKGVSAYYELSTNDFYLLSALSNRRIRPSDVLTLSFGLRFLIF